MTKAIQRVEIIVANDGDSAKFARRVADALRPTVTFDLRVSRVVRLRIWIALMLIRLATFITPGVQIRTKSP